MGYDARRADRRTAGAVNAPRRPPRRDGRRGARVALLLVVALATAATALVPTPAGATATGTRYLDPVFAGQIAPAVTASYDPSIELNRDSTLVVTGGGTYTISYAGSTTLPLAANATAAQVATALRTLPSMAVGNDVVVTGGPGGGSGGHAYRIAFTGPAPDGGFGRLTTDGSALTGVVKQAMVQCDRCLDLYQPVEAVPPAAGRPVVVLLHSGGFVGGAKDAIADPAAGSRMQTWAAALAGRGYVVASINYTLSDPVSVGMADCDWDAVAGPACPQAWYDAVAAAQHDAQAAIRWLRMTAAASSAGGLDNPYALDADHVMVVGESAGAFAALNVLYKPDDPGTVGVTAGSSAVSSAASLAGMMKDADQRAGAGPALLLTFTNDPLGQLLGQDMYEQSRQVVARAGAVGNLAELASYCRRMPTAPGGPDNPVHLVATDQPEFADQVNRVSQFFYRHVVGPTLSGVASPSVWSGGTPSVPFDVHGGQSLYGHHDSVVGDFDGDGRADVVQYGHGSECDTVWFGGADHTFSDPKEMSWSGFTPAIDLGGSYRSVVADFDGDGRQDILWYDPTTSIAMLWFGNADRTFTSVALPLLAPGLEIAAGDFDGDGRADILLYSPAYGVALVAFGSAVRGNLTGVTYLLGPAGARKPIVGDFDGDHHDDVFWQGSTGSAIWYGLANAGAASFAVASSAPTISGSNAPMVGDVDGDGKADLFWYEPGKSALWYGQSARTGFVAGRTWTTYAGWTTTSGDFDADGRLDIYWHNPLGSDGIWYGLASRSSGFTSRSVGANPATGLAPVGGRFAGTMVAGRPISDLLWVSP